MHLLIAIVWAIVINFHSCMWSFQQKTLTVQILWIEKKIAFQHGHYLISFVPRNVAAVTSETFCNDESFAILTVLRERLLPSFTW